ncbi:glycosyltransferase [Chitinophaga sp. NPDC101104]|uniref:glycosyltransferase family 4 protein n=1 Tax=Chitinophaga sp. NPDC101104 TaxID=3390561 RepID=UPI003D07DDA7
MRIAYIASYYPRECGIATFTEHLIKAMQCQYEAPEVSVIAMNDEGQEYDYPPEVAFTIRQQQMSDYLDAADWVNGSGIDLVVVQHEFGIFGGESGIFLLPFLHRLKVPFIATFHTVLKEPSFLQKSIVREISRQAERVVVMSRLAISFLEDIYEVSPDKISHIPHGVPDFGNLSIRADVVPDNLRDRKLIFTFGLLSRNKGIETVINALPQVIERHPDVMYVVAGKTHPAVLRNSGEEYRQSLQQLVNNLGLGDHVLFLDKFLTENDLFAWLTRSQIYVTPYLSEAQITSGTLTYALGAGAAVLSTPYWYATELLANGRGKLFGFAQHETLGQMILSLLNEPAKLEALREKASEYGRELQWSRMGARYLQLAVKVLSIPRPTVLPDPLPDPSALPPLNLTHIRRLTDDTGIVQHAKYGIPNLKEGYCVDDNARALMMTLMAQQFRKGKEAPELLPVYLSFIHYMQTPDGNFRNFLSFSRQYLDEVGSEDSFGRTVWALGYLIRFAPNNSYREFAYELFHRSIQHFAALEHLRGRANSIIGVCHYILHHPADEGMVHVLEQLIQPMIDAWERNATDEWQWFEKSMTYDNGILPLAMLHAAEATGNEKWRNIALTSLSFLENLTMAHGYFSPVGNNGWHCEGGACPLFDQQAIETMAMVLLYQQAYAATNETDYLRKMYTCYQWFLGENVLRIPLYDHETHGCCDGLSAAGLNRNQGAESTLAYFISHIAVLQTCEAIPKPEKSVRTTIISTNVVSKIS